MTVGAVVIVTDGLDIPAGEVVGTLVEVACTDTFDAVVLERLIVVAVVAVDGS